MVKRYERTGAPADVDETAQNATTNAVITEDFEKSPDDLASIINAGSDGATAVENEVKISAVEIYDESIGSMAMMVPTPARCR